MSTAIVYITCYEVKYELEAVYDPCSYPAVKCKFYLITIWGSSNETQNGRIVDEDMNMMTELGETKKIHGNIVYDI
jgi:hypothetical protein